MPQTFSALIPANRCQLADPEFRTEAEERALKAVARQVAEAHPGANVTSMAVVFDGVEVFLIDGQWHTERSAGQVPLAAPAGLYWAYEVTV